MTAAPIRIAVVGHTNTGKTSLLRTLTRNAQFGKVDNNAGTTRHVEGARLSRDGQPVLEWLDTPGIEDSIALLEYVEQLCERVERLDGPARIRRFLDSPEAKRRFEQEARVLQALLNCDAALYVIDARESVLAKHRDELDLLADCGKPLIPILNFVTAPSHRAAEWRDAMARLGLHALLEFVTVAPALNGESMLYGKLSVLLDSHSEALTWLADDLQRKRHARRQTAAALIAEMLIDVASLHIRCAPHATAVAEAAEMLRKQVRQREQACVASLLALYQFAAVDYAETSLPLEGERWGTDAFHPQALKQMGIQVGAGVAAGAVAGAAVDLMTAGLSLGTGILIGAMAGGVWQGVERFGKRIVGRLRGHREMSVEDGVLRLLALRQQHLVRALDARGHAAQTPVSLTAPQDNGWRTAPLPSALSEARSRPDWSAMSADFSLDGRRKVVVGQLATHLLNEP